MGSGASSGDPAWFQRQFGFSEAGKSLDEIRERFTLDPKGNVLTSIDRPDRSFTAGRFENLSLSELRKRMAKLDPAVKKSLQGKLKVRESVSDVSALHILPENRCALFQAASQFNCLEFPSERCTPEAGIANYAHDQTQGPACAIACGPGTVVRNYFGIGGNPNDRSAARPQRKDNQINNLQDIEGVLENDSKKYFKVTNGYTMATDNSLYELGNVLQKSTELQDKVADHLRIGMQWDTEVVCSEFGRSDYKGEPQCQLVTQAYCSGCSVSYSGCKAFAWEPFASLVLRACFEATMTAGLLNAAAHPEEPGARRVFLTAIGGGVFGNDMMWVQDAMKRAFEKFKDYNLEVTLVSYGRPTPEFQPLLSSAHGGQTPSLANQATAAAREKQRQWPDASLANQATSAKAKARAEKLTALSEAKAGGKAFLFTADKLGEGSNTGTLQARLKEEGF